MGIKKKGLLENKDSIFWSLFKKDERFLKNAPQNNKFAPKSILEAFDLSEKTWLSRLEYVWSYHVFAINNVVTKLNIIVSGDDPSVNRKLLTIFTCRLISLSLAKFKKIILSKEQAKAIIEEREFLKEKIDFLNERNDKHPISYIYKDDNKGNFVVNIKNLENLPAFDSNKTSTQSASSIPYHIPVKEIEKVGGFEFAKKEGFNENLTAELVDKCYLERWENSKEFPIFFAFRDREGNVHNALLSARWEKSELYATHLPTEELPSDSFFEHISECSDIISSS